MVGSIISGYYNDNGYIELIVVRNKSFLCWIFLFGGDIESQHT